MGCAIITKPSLSNKKKAFDTIPTTLPTGTIQ